MLVSANLSDPAELIQRMTRSLFTEEPDGSLYHPTSFAGGELVSVQRVVGDEFTLAFSSHWKSATPQEGGYSDYTNDLTPVLLRVNARSGVSVTTVPVVPTTNFSYTDTPFELTEMTLVSGTTDSQFHYLAYRCTGTDGKQYVLLGAFLSTASGTFFNLSRYLPTEGLAGRVVDCTLRGEDFQFTFSDGEELQFVRVSKSDFFDSSEALIRKRTIWGGTGWGIESVPRSLSGVGRHSLVSSFEYRGRQVMVVSGDEESRVFTLDERTSRLSKKLTLEVPHGRVHPALVSQGSSIPVSYPDVQTEKAPFKNFSKWTSIPYDSISS